MSGLWSCWSSYLHGVHVSSTIQKTFIVTNPHCTPALEPFKYKTVVFVIAIINFHRSVIVIFLEVNEWIVKWILTFLDGTQLTKTQRVNYSFERTLTFHWFSFGANCHSHCGKEEFINTLKFRVILNCETVFAELEKETFRCSPAARL